MSKAKETEILICGCGIVGLTIAKRLLETGRKKIVIIEKENEIAKHASGRNSGVLHAGIYYKPGSLKAKLTLQGNFLIKEYCRKNNLSLLETGKVIVTRNEKELEVLNELYDRAIKNGAKVELIDEKKLKSLEPLAKTHKMALYSYYTAVIDPKEILHCLYEELVASGKVEILTNTAFIDLDQDDIAITGSGKIKFETFINAAGAYSDRVAHSFGVGFNYKLVPFKGTYRKLISEKASLIKSHIYPVPDIENPFLGVHFTKSVNGDVYLGPTAIPAFGRENYELFAGIDSEALDIMYRDIVLFFLNRKFRKVACEEPKKYLFKYFYEDARTLVHDLTPDDIEESTKVGIRPQLVDWKRKELIMDFKVIKQNNSVHVLNAVSPAFTSSMTFAGFVVDQYLF